MKIAVVLMKYDYGIKERGFSYEYVNVFLPLQDLYGDDVILFDFKTELNSLGREGMNAKVTAMVNSEKPDCTLFCLFENEFIEENIKALGKKTKTIAYFFDDPWRQNFVRHWIQYFDYFTTSDYYMYLQYISEGINNSILCPFGFNNKVYEKRVLPKQYDVSFVGGYSPLRRWIINRLEKQGIRTAVFGRGWNGNNSFVNQDELVNIFNQSKINLNLSNAISYDVKFILSSLFSPKDMKEILLLKKTREQVKGRHFEISGCGGFQLSFYVHGLNYFYELEKEIVAFDNPDNLAELINFYLKNDNLREQIALAGYERSKNDHSAQGYLKKLIENDVKYDQ